MGELLAVEGPDDHLSDPGPSRRVVRDLVVHCGRRRVRRHGRGVGLGEEPHGARRPRTATAVGRAHGALDPPRRRGARRRFRGDAAARARRAVGMVFQEPMTALNPVLTIGFQIVEAIRAHRDTTKEEARQEGATSFRARGDPEAGQPARRLPAPALGRAASARHDRHGPGRRAAPADRRRADDGARRDDPGADPRSAARAAGAARPGDSPDHPRSRRRRRDLRPGAGDVRRAPRRGGRLPRLSSARRRTPTPEDSSPPSPTWRARASARLSPPSPGRFRIPPIFPAGAPSTRAAPRRWRSARRSGQSSIRWAAVTARPAFSTHPIRGGNVPLLEARGGRQGVSRPAGPLRTHPGRAARGRPRRPDDRAGTVRGPRGRSPAAARRPWLAAWSAWSRPPRARSSSTARTSSSSTR